jgi:sugar lactone lactonase YvrE
MKHTTSLVMTVVLLGCGDVTANLNGLTVDARGDLVLAYGGYNLIRVVKPSTGERVRDLTRGVRVPDDVEVDPTGASDATWWTSLLSGEIGRSSTDGPAVVLADLGTGANSIALSPDGRLIVGRCGLGVGDDLFALDPHRPSTPQVVFADIGVGCSLNGMRFGTDGWLYGAQPTMGRVVRVRLEGQVLEVLAESLSAESYAVALDAENTVFALDGKRVITVRQGQVETFVELPVRGDNLVFSADGRELLVSTGPDMRVLAFDVVTREQRTVVSGPPADPVRPVHHAETGRTRSRSDALSGILGFQAVRRVRVGTRATRVSTSNDFVELDGRPT